MEDIGVNNTLNELRTFIDTCQIISRLVQQAHNNELPIIDCSNVIQMAEFTMQFNVDEKTNETKITINLHRRLENVIYRPQKKIETIESPIFRVILHYFGAD